MRTGVAGGQRRINTAACMNRDERVTSFGRIFFPGNPWPEGHRIKEFAWSGRLDAKTGLWFDLHVRGAD